MFVNRTKFLGKSLIFIDKFNFPIDSIRAKIIQRSPNQERTLMFKRISFLSLLTITFFITASHDPTDGPKPLAGEAGEGGKGIQIPEGGSGIQIPEGGMGIYRTDEGGQNLTFSFYGPKGSKDGGNQIDDGGQGIQTREGGSGSHIPEGGNNSDEGGHGLSLPEGGSNLS